MAAWKRCRFKARLSSSTDNSSANRGHAATAMAKALSSGRRRCWRTARIDTVARPPLNNENNALVEVVEGRVDQFRETLPLLDLNLTGHAENPRGWTATRIETASAKAWTGPACTYRTSGSARVAAAYPGALAPPITAALRAFSRTFRVTQRGAARGWSPRPASCQCGVSDLPGFAGRGPPGHLSAAAARRPGPGRRPGGQRCLLLRLPD